MILYSGSLIQQNHGEGNLHGIVKWNVKNNTHKFIPIENDYGFRTVYVINNKLKVLKDGNYRDISIDDIIVTFPNKLSLRIKNDKSDKLIIDEFISKIKLHFDLKNLLIVDVDSNSEILEGEQKDKTDLQATHHLINKVSYQNEIISKLHKQVLGYELKSDYLQKIYDLNAELNKVFLNVEDNNSYGSIIKLKELSFDNMFSYGKGNYINFESLHGVVGLFAPNTQGKSSIMQILLFMLYDKSNKISKTIDILNINKKDFFAKLSFEIDNNVYYIEKRGKLDNKDKLKFSIDFYTYKDKERKSLNGEQRRDTVKLIQNMIGSYDNTVMTNIVLQQDDSFNFIKKTQSERRVLLSKFLGLDIYQQLYKQAQGLYKDNKSKFEYLIKENINFTLSEIKQDLIEHKKELNVLTDNLVNCTNNLNQYKDIRNKLRNRIKTVDVPSDSLDELESNKVKLEKIIKVKSDEQMKIVQIIDQLTKQNNLKKEKFKQYNKDELTNLYNTYNNNKELIFKYKTQQSSLQSKNDNITKSLNVISDFVYDIDNCSHCKNNNEIQIKGLKQFNSTFADNEQQIKEISNNIDKLISDNKSCEPSIHKYNQMLLLNEEVDELNNKIEKLNNQLKLLNNDLDINNERLVNVNNKIKQYNKVSSIIIKNKEYQSNLNDINIEIEEIEQQCKNVESRINQLNIQIEVKSDKVSDLNNKRDDMKKLEIEMKLLEHYSKLVHHTGLPFYILSNVIEKLNNEVNKILTQIADFTLEFEIFDKNIEIYIKYDKNRWLLDLNSGMENFISNIAVRIALTKITILPKTEFMFIDEGWASLDKENIVKVPNLFDYLKQFYKYVIIVSHIDTMKDDVDMHMDINKENSFSKIIVN